MNIKAVWLGVIESRSDYTTHFDNLNHEDLYEKSRHFVRAYILKISD